MMKSRLPKLAGALLTLGVAITSRNASALEESTRRPFYVQGTVASFAVWTDLPLTSGVYWHPDVEFGVHFTGRHDGVVLGIRQAFDVGHAPLGETLLRGGYDIALPLRNGRYELTIAPFGTFGANYLFDGPHAGVHFSIGIEGKLFFYEGLFLLVRPIELAIGEFVTPPFLYKNVVFNLNAGVGLGFAF